MSELSAASELIQRFIDGDTSELEQDLLFKQLAHDQELQTELQQSLAIRHATQNESRNTFIPVALTERIMQGALGAPVPAVSAAITAPSSSTSFLRHTILVLCSAITGAMLMYLLNDSNAASSSQQTAVDHVASNMSGDSVGAASNAITGSAATLPAHYEASVPPVSAQPHRHSKRRAPVPANEGAKPDWSDELKAEELVQPGASNTAITMIDVASEDLALSQLPLRASVMQTILEQVSDPAAQHRLRIRMLASATLMQERGLAQPTQWYENLAIGYDYALSDEHMIGVSGGAEYFPLFVVGRDTFLPRLSMLWAGLTYSFEPDLFRSDVIRPTATCIAGASGSGPIAKGLIGLRIDPVQGFSSHVQFEFTEVVLRNAGNWYGTQKYNVSYGISATF
jgi:hypothetical protein